VIDAPVPAPDLTPDEVRRYARHLSLAEVGRDGQRRLKAARVLLVGAGGLGSPAALYLAAAGIGTLGIVESDVVDATNLQRQILHGTSELGRPKLESAARRLADLNPGVRVQPHAVRLTSANALDVLRGYDVVIDGSDNFPTRYLVNDACALLGLPDVYGAILRFEGQVSIFDARRGPCYRCLFRDPPPPGLVPDCATAGVLGVLPGVIGSLQALEAIKLLLGRGDTLLGRLLMFDGLAATFREIRLTKDPDCPLCGAAPTIRQLIDYEEFCGMANTTPRDNGDVTAVELDKERGVNPNLVLVDVRESFEWDICRLPGAVLIPMGELEDRLGELDKQKDVVAYCHTGRRSRIALDLLREAGFSRARHLAGGIAAWSHDVDPATPTY
jgi:adenylyltransferase/sulfurtransferase